MEADDPSLIELLKQEAHLLAEELGHDEAEVELLRELRRGEGRLEPLGHRRVQDLSCKFKTSTRIKL